MQKRLIISLILFFTLNAIGFSGGYLAISASNKPYKWNANAFPIEFRTDRGNCGALSNQEMVDLINDVLSEWSKDKLPNCSLSFKHDGSLSLDVKTKSQYEAATGTNNGVNPIVFDEDGSLFADMGLEPGVIGFASPKLITGEPFNHIIKGVAAFNGNFLDGDTKDGYELSKEQFGAIILHEFGHMLNLDHTQVNGQHFLQDYDPGFQAYGDPPISAVNIMFPISLRSGEPTVPQADDIATITNLYPSNSFSQNTKTISGKIYLSDGSTPFNGANVIARNPANPFADVASNVSGSFTNGQGSSSMDGYFEINGLSDGVSYTLEMTNINADFSGSSSVGPLDNPALLDAPEEFYNGDNESANPEIDNPDERVAVLAGTENIKIIINNNTTDVEEKQAGTEILPEKNLLQNYPNPFNPSTTVKFTLFQSNKVEMNIVDLQGRIIRNLANNHFPAGEHQIIWNGKNNAGHEVAAGVYFAKLRLGTNNAILSKKMLFLK